MKTFRSIVVAAAALGISGLSGCNDGGTGDVSQWMEEVRRQTPVSVKKLPEPKSFAPFTYAAGGEIDPYDPMKLAAALARLEASAGSGIKPDLDRRRELLESHPLDTVTMVGTLQKPGLNYALLLVDKSIFHVKVGNYVGQNFGMITQITDTEVKLKEVVRDASGEWVERMAKLELQESKK
jgi:type IV pilus assembly protein PilP